MFACMMFVAMMIALDDLRKGEAPRPRSFLAAYVVFVALTLAAQFGPSGARFASAFAILVALGVGIAKAPGLLSLNDAMARQSATAQGGNA